MQRLIKHPLGWLVVSVSLAVGLLNVPEAAPGAAAGRLPVVEPLRHAKYVETIPGTKVRFEMVPIPGGTYLMGSPPGEPGRGADEGPQHPVTIRPLWVGKFEVTWDEYDLWWRSNPGNKQ
jgi:formylglycine-generating enzyme required for sulfatase activity